jgi:FPC/CPF motif-containing protein YcgG
MDVVERIRDELTQLITSPDYPCIGARSSLRRAGTQVEVYGPMTEPETTRRLAADLEQFAADEAAGGSRTFVAFVAIFAEAAPDTELAFETRLWGQLTSLAAHDAGSAWSPKHSADADDPHFAFSLGGTPFFVIGLHPESSRIARRLAWPALVFNPHAQFDRLRAEDRFESMRRTIRARDVKLQGSVNPNLADAGERSEARQYSGRATEAGWRCPFHRPGA